MTDPIREALDALARLDPHPGRPRPRSGLVAVHRELRGSGYRGLASIIGEVRLPIDVQIPDLNLDGFAERFDRRVLDGFELEGPISPETVRALYGADLEAARRILDDEEPSR